MKCCCCRFRSIRKQEDDEISIKEVRQTLYSRYESELRNLWGHSAFAWGFEILLFTGYGYLIANFFLDYDKSTNLFVCNIIAVFLSFVGLCTSAIWIALAKASKTWQEVFEAQITELEGNSKYFKSPRVFAMGGFHNRLQYLDSSLSTSNIGQFSPGRLNIFTAQFVWIIWSAITTANILFGPFVFIKPLLFLTVILLYWLFHSLILKRCSNDYFREEDYGNEYIFELIQKINRVEKHLEKIKKDKESLCDFFCNDYLGLSWSIFKVYEKDSFLEWEEWEEERFLKLFKQFKEDYVKGMLEDNTSEIVCVYEQQILKNLEFYKKQLRSMYV